MGDTPQSLSAPNAVRQSDAKRLDHVDGSEQLSGKGVQLPPLPLGHNDEGAPVDGVVVQRASFTCRIRLMVGLMILSHVTGDRNPYSVLVCENDHMQEM